MLEVRKHASELFEVMGEISNNYSNTKGRTVPEFVRALIEAEKDQRRLTALLRSSAEMREKEIAGIIAAFRFVSDCTKETYSSGVNVGGKAMSIQFTEIFRVAIHRLETIRTGDKGLLEGKQPHNSRDFIAELSSDKKDSQ